MDPGGELLKTSLHLVELFPGSRQPSGRVPAVRRASFLDGQVEEIPDP